MADERYPKHGTGMDYSEDLWSDADDNDRDKEAPEAGQVLVFTVNSAEVTVDEAPAANLYGFDFDPGAGYILDFGNYDLTLTDLLDMMSGVLVMNAGHTITMAGNQGDIKYTDFSGFAGTIVYSGTLTTRISDTVGVPDVEINTAGTITVDIDWNVGDLTLTAGTLDDSGNDVQCVDYSEANGTEYTGTGNLICSGSVTHTTGEGPVHSHTGPLKMTTDNADIEWDAITYALPHLYIDDCDVDFAGKVRVKKITLNGAGSFHTDSADILVLYAGANDFWTQGTGIPTLPIIQFLAESAVTNVDHVKCLPTTFLYLGTDSLTNSVTLTSGLDISINYDVEVYYTLVDDAAQGHVIIGTTLLCRDIYLGIAHGTDRSGQLTLQNGTFVCRNLVSGDPANAVTCKLILVNALVSGAGTSFDFEQDAGVIALEVDANGASRFASKALLFAQPDNYAKAWGCTLDADCTLAKLEVTPREMGTAPMLGLSSAA